jgi:hypothetical protein
VLLHGAGEVDADQCVVTATMIRCARASGQRRSPR